MKFAKLNLCFFLLPLLILQIVVLSEPQVPCFFIFGDSLVDNGNNNDRKTNLKVNYFPYGIDFLEGPTGRFTNGRTIVDILAELLGFHKYISPFANCTSDDILRGVNYASGGGGILNVSNSKFGDVINLSKQLSNHEVIVSRVTELLGSHTASKQHLNTCIYLVAMGNNDYLANYFLQLYSSISALYTPQQFAALVITQYSKHLRKLYNYGARKVAVVKLGKLGSVPQMLATYGSSEIGNNAVQIFNKNLKCLINGLNNQFPDAKFVYTRDISSASSYGNIRILNAPCCSVQFNISGFCLRGIVPCNNRDEYMYFDAFHPTEAANLISAKIAYNDMSSLYADPINIW